MEGFWALYNGLIDYFDLDPENYKYTQWLFLRSYSWVLMTAFLTESKQLMGLWGSKGIIPIKQSLDNLRQQVPGYKRFYYVQSLFWLNSSDPFIRFVNVTGIVTAFLAMINVATVPMLIISLVCWQSFLSSGSYFMRRQSDTLMVEVGFFAVIYGLTTPMIWPTLLYGWFLMFKFMFSAGVVKILSGDPTWRDGTALSYHYESQPLPNRISWYLHQMPMWTHRVGTYVMFVIEIIFPFLIVFPAEVKFAVFMGFFILQAAIFLTGNLTFFNTLTVALSTLLVEDRFLEPWLGGLVDVDPTGEPMIITQVVVWGICIGLSVLSVFHLLCIVLKKNVGIEYLQAMQPFHINNRYGLFAVMTKGRKEVVVEGSHDGEVWEEYEFNWKAGDLSIPPRQMAPHHPRLDWQMWFAGLSSYQREPWIRNMLAHLLEETPEVLSLFMRNPFEGDPPTMLRCVLYDYKFTSFAERRETGNWWKRECLGLFHPPIAKRKAEATKPQQSTGSSFTSFN